MEGTATHSGPCGEFDLYVVLANRFKWGPEAVNALDPHFVDELLASIKAEQRLEKAREKRREREDRIRSSSPPRRGRRGR